MRYYENALQHAAAELLVSEGLPTDALLRLRVVGKSMCPALLPGDYLIIAPADVIKLRRGDIVVVRRSDGFVTHRLISVEQGEYLLKGDGQYYPDQPTTEEDIVGIVKRFERGGAIYDFNTRPLMRLNRFLGWLGLVEVRWRFILPVTSILSLLKRWIVHLSYFSGHFVSTKENDR